MELGSSVGIATGRTIGVRFPTGVRDFSLLFRVETVSDADPASYPMGICVSFPGGKGA
jgi:hypothetical protein